MKAIAASALFFAACASDPDPSEARATQALRNQPGETIEVHGCSPGLLDLDDGVCLDPRDALPPPFEEPPRGPSSGGWHGGAGGGGGVSARSDGRFSLVLLYGVVSLVASCVIYVLAQGIESTPERYGAVMISGMFQGGGFGGISRLDGIRAGKAPWE